MRKAAQPTLFVRETTGLVKNVTFLDAISLNVSNMSVGAALAVLGFTMVNLTSVSGINLVYGSLLAFLLSIPQIIVYTLLTMRYPRDGGDYVWLSRTFGGLTGASLSFMGFTLEAMAYLALISLSAVFAIGSVGLFFGYSGFFGIAVPSTVPGATPAQQFALGAIIFAILIGINVVKPKAGYKVVTGLMIIGGLGLLVAIGELISAGQSGVANYINSLGSFIPALKTTTYASVAKSYSGPSFDLGATIFLLPFFSAFIYPWINAGPAVASEIKGRSSIRWNVPISAVISFILATAGFGAMYYAAGQGFINAAFQNPALVFEGGFNFWTLAMGVSNNNAVATFIGIGWIAWNLAILAYGIIVISRYLFAQSFDRFLPGKIAYVSTKFGSPIFAHLFDLVVTVVLIGLAAFLYGTLQALFGAIIASMIYFIFVGLAAAVHGARKERGGSSLVLAVSGIIMAAVFVYVSYLFVAYPDVWGLTPLSYTYVVASFVISLAIYLVSKSYHKKRGIDLSLVYKEIPPE